MTDSMHNLRVAWIWRAWFYTVLGVGTLAFGVILGPGTCPGILNLDTWLWGLVPPAIVWGLVWVFFRKPTSPTETQ